MALGAQVPRGQVQVPAAGLGVEQGDGPLAGQGGPGRDRRGQADLADLAAENRRSSSSSGAISGTCDSRSRVSR
jgi:hypothetical protein